MIINDPLTVTWYFFLQNLKKMLKIAKWVVFFRKKIKLRKLHFNENEFASV